ncbi:MAG: hypothetical protein ACI9JM_001128 [Halioglobus sp.]|jgi:hypothetical protein
MARKNLNLSLDRDLLEPSIDPNWTLPDPENGVRLVSDKQKKRTPEQTQGHVGGRPWTAITVGIIAVANMLFLLTAGIWLSGHSFNPPAQLRPALAEITPELELILVQIDNRLNTIEQQLGGLHLALNEQQSTTVPDSFNIDSHMREALSQYENTPSAPTPAPGWYINLGNFDGKEVALELQQRLQAIGLQSQIKTSASADTTSFLVVLPGFSDRESAELAAKQIMEQTDLNSLWVAQEE